MRITKETLQQENRALRDLLGTIKDKIFGEKNCGPRTPLQVIDQCELIRNCEQKAIEDLAKIQGRIDDRCDYLTKENDRLWYLLRALLKDDTLKDTLPRVTKDNGDLGNLITPFNPYNPHVRY